MKKSIPLLVLSVILFSCSTGKLALFPEDSVRKDAVFSLLVPDNNYGGIEDIHLFTWTQGGRLNVNRVLIDFDLDSIPKGTIIDKAYLNLYFNPTSKYDVQNGNKGSDDFVIQRVISDWNETDATWNRQPETTKENQILVKRKKSPFSDYTKINITPILQDIIDCSKNERYGIMLRLANEQPYNIILFASSNHPNASLHPKLIMKYKKK